jgi:hypothetical protein
VPSPPWCAAPRRRARATGHPAPPGSSSGARTAPGRRVRYDEFRRRPGSPRRHRPARPRRRPDQQ